MTINKPTTYWAPSTALHKLESRHNNAPCILTDGPAEFNDVALVRLAEYEALQSECDQQYDTTTKILKLILDECQYWHGRDEARRGGYAILYAKAKELISNQQPAPDVAGLMGVLGQYFDAMDSIGREGTATSTLIAEAECDEAEARLRVLLANHRKQEPSHDNQ